MGTLYKIENVSNSKCYYGQTTGTAKRRKSDHFSALRRGVHWNRHLQDSWNKYGETKFTFTVISDSERDDCLDELETKLISVFNTTDNAFGYNKTSGGNANKKFSPEAVENNRIAQKKFHKENPSAAAKMSKIKRDYYAAGNKPPMCGKAWSDDTKAKIRLSLKEWYANGGKNTKAKPVIDLETKEIYPTIKEASIALGFNEGRFCLALKNNKAYRGRQFAYASSSNEGCYV